MVFVSRIVGKVTHFICIVASFKAGGANSSDFQVGRAIISMWLSVTGTTLIVGL